MKIKKGTNVNGLKPEIVLIFPVVESVYKEYGAEAVLTSGVDSKHGDHSHHYKGLATDWRTRNVEKQFHTSLTKRLRDSLSEQYQVVYERNHIHIEFDPKN